MRTFTLFILILFSGLSKGQGFSYPTINNKGGEINDFIPSGWIIIDSAKGDLNKDGIADAVVVLQHKDSIYILKSEDTVLTQPRILLILFKDSVEVAYNLIERSNTFILSHDDAIMDDPYQGLTIHKGVLKIEFHLFYNMGSWSTTSSDYKFRYNGKEFLLIGADIFTIHRATLDYEQFSYNFLTNKRIQTKGNEEKGNKKSAVKSILNVQPMTFKRFTEPYTWEVESGVYL